jgi:hypothetical protein
VGCCSSLSCATDAVESGESCSLLSCPTALEEVCFPGCVSVVTNRLNPHLAVAASAVEEEGRKSAASSCKMVVSLHRLTLWCLGDVWR